MFGVLLEEGGVCLADVDLWLCCSTFWLVLNVFSRRAQGFLTDGLDCRSDDVFR